MATSAGSLEAIYNFWTYKLLHLLCEMDQKVKIKKEPVRLEGTTHTSLVSFQENFEPVSEMIHPKQENKSVLTVPGPTQEKKFKLSADIKEEIFIENHTVDQLVPYVKEEINVENVAVLDMPTEEKMHRCTMCNMMFSQEYNLSKHLLDHCDERQFVCDTCGGIYRTKKILLQHMIIHSGAAPYRCQHCSRTFKRRGNLRSHMDFHSAQRPYHCKQCSKTFSRRGGLQTHMIVHSLDRPYTCNHCDSTFRRRNNLIDHIAVHTARKQFSCKQCNSTFAFRRYLQAHTVVHSSFTRRGNLRNDLVIHTKNKP